MEFVDYYFELELSPEATIEDIKKNFRRLALAWHPDVNHSSNAQEKFISIYKAYAILSNATTKKEYDILYHNMQGRYANTTDTCYETAKNDKNAYRTNTQNSTTNNSEQQKYQNGTSNMDEVSAKAYTSVAS